MDNKQYFAELALKFFSDVALGISDEENRAEISALGIIIRENRTDNEAVARVRRMGESLTLAEFRQWLPRFMAEFGAAARGK